MYHFKKLFFAAMTNTGSFAFFKLHIGKPKDITLILILYNTMIFRNYSRAISGAQLHSLGQFLFQNIHFTKQRPSTGSSTYCAELVHITTLSFKQF